MIPGQLGQNALIEQELIRRRNKHEVNIAVERLRGQEFERWRPRDFMFFGILGTLNALAWGAIIIGFETIIAWVQGS